MSARSSVNLASLRNLFEEQRKTLGYSFDQLNFDEISEFCSKIYECRGSTIFTGVGQTASIAKKVSQTLISTGTRSGWLSPVDALHGDIGNVTSKDNVVMLSEFGDTDELITLLPYLRAKGAYVIAATASPESKLGSMADFHVKIPCHEQNIYVDDGTRKVHQQCIRITCSVMQMLFGDTCAVYLMELRGLTQNQYALNHPAGRIGKRLVLTVNEVMKSWESLPLVHPDDLGLDALVHMAGTSKGCGCLLVVNDKRQLLGTFADADLRRALTHGGEKVLKLRVKDLMNFNKEFPRTIAEDALAYEAQRKMEEKNPVDYLPVVSGDEECKLVGLLTTHLLTQAGL